MLLLWKKNTVNTDWGGGGKQTFFGNFFPLFSTIFLYGGREIDLQCQEDFLRKTH